LQRRADADDANLFTFFANQADFRYRDFFIEAVRLVLSDGSTPENDKN